MFSNFIIQELYQKDLYAYLKSSGADVNHDRKINGCILTDIQILANVFCWGRQKGSTRLRRVKFPDFNKGLVIQMQKIKEKTNIYF